MDIIEKEGIKLYTVSKGERLSIFLLGKDFQNIVDKYIDLLEGIVNSKSVVITLSGKISSTSCYTIIYDIQFSSSSKKLGVSYKKIMYYRHEDKMSNYLDYKDDEISSFIDRYFYGHNFIVLDGEKMSREIELLGFNKIELILSKYFRFIMNGVMMDLVKGNYNKLEKVYNIKVGSYLEVVNHLDKISNEGLDVNKYFLIEYTPTFRGLNINYGFERKKDWKLFRVDNVYSFIIDKSHDRDKFDTVKAFNYYYYGQTLSFEYAQNFGNRIYSLIPINLHPNLRKLLESNFRVIGLNVLNHRLIDELIDKITGKVIF